MVGWQHQLSGPEFEQNPGTVKGREAWYSVVHGVAESDITVQLKNNKN